MLGAAFALLGLGAVLVCATSDVAKNTVTQSFHADFIALSFFLSS
jgi:hypothetical protein